MPRRNPHKPAVTSAVPQNRVMTLAVRAALRAIGEEYIQQKRLEHFQSLDASERLRLIEETRRAAEKIGVNPAVGVPA